MSFDELTYWQWALAGGAAFLVGVSKTGVSGLGILAVAVFAIVITSTKAASGLVLPLLIAGDLQAVLLYRQHAQWRHLARLAPFTAVGVFAGWWVMGAWNDHAIRLLVGVIVLTLLSVQVWRQSQSSGSASGSESSSSPHVVLASVIGMLIGFSTMVANAAGPLMAVYLLLMSLPKYEFMGTSAVFFMILNWVKVPFAVNLGIIQSQSLVLDAMLVPFVLVGGLLGRLLLARIGQKTFERIALGLGFAAGVKLCWF